MTLDLLIFDFDGVLSDSEVLSGLSLVQTLGELGLPMTLEEVEARFIGMGSQQMIEDLHVTDGLIVPDDFQARNWRIVQRLMHERLQAVPHAAQMLADLPPDLPKCIASNSFADWIDLALSLTGLERFFDPSVRFNADMVAQGKPAPDLHRHVLNAMGGVDPRHALIIEDTTTGLNGGLAAGIEVWGCVAVSLHPEAQSQTLKRAGATEVIWDLRELPALIHARQSPSSGGG